MAHVIFSWHISAVKKVWNKLTNWFLADYLVHVQDSFQRARIRLTFNLAVFYLLLGTPPLIEFWTSGRKIQFFVSLAVLGIYFSIPFLLKLLHRLLPAALLFGVSGVILLATNNYFVEGELTMLTGLWGMVIVLYVHFVLGKRWGAIFTIGYGLHIIGFWYLNTIDYAYPLTQDLGPQADPPVLIQLIPLAFLYYLVWEYLRQGKRAEQELQFSLTMESRLNRELEEQLEKQQMQEEVLRKAKQVAERSARMRTDFLSSMSHEIRTPMNGVVGIANVLLQEDPKPEQRENLEILRFSAENLLSLIDNILDFNKLESGRMVLDARPFSLPELLQRATRLWQANADRKGLKLSYTMGKEVPDWVVGDPVKLTQIMNNLINNALRFTDKGGVTLSAELVEELDRHVRIALEVTDRGVGIPDEELEKVFDTFFQAKQNEHGRGGTGLGLAIVKKLIELFNGTIQVQSEVGVGTRFRLEFFLGKTQAPKVEVATKVDKDPLCDRHVLVVEDNLTNRLVARKILSRWRIAVEEAENGKLAIEALVRSPYYDAILLDLQMPEMDGYETAEWIRSQSDPYFKSVPIIALTAAALPEVRERILQLGVDDFITKPFDPQELREKLERLIIQRATKE